MIYDDGDDICTYNVANNLLQAESCSPPMQYIFPPQDYPPAEVKSLAKENLNYVSFKNNHEY